MTQDHTPDGLSRRTFLRTAAVAGASLAIAPAIAQTADSSKSSTWSDPATWGGRVPSNDAVAVITRSVMLDRDVTVAGFEIVRQGGELVFDPEQSRTLESTANVVVEGDLADAALHPGGQRISRSSSVRWTRRVFEGGGMDVLDSDVGLWVMERGRLRLRGSQRRAWTRASGTVEAGVPRDHVGTGRRSRRLARRGTSW